MNSIVMTLEEAAEEFPVIYEAIPEDLIRSGEYLCKVTATGSGFRFSIMDKVSVN